MPGACSELANPHPNPKILDTDNTTRDPSFPGAAARSWVLGQVFPRPAVIQSFILATDKFLQLFPCFMSTELSAASLAPVLGQRPHQHGEDGVTHGLLAHVGWTQPHPERHLTPALIQLVSACHLDGCGSSCAVGGGQQGSGGPIWTPGFFCPFAAP